ncbi:MAG: dihydrofolate reductase [Chloroflexi bacterium]|nr:dihydrofolate reductase [Chloroflexota bacterium]
MKRKMVVLTFVSLDGVMQAPGGKGEDPSRGFDLEGWTVPYFDEAAGEVMDEQMGMPFDLLLGRKTYDIFASYWPHRDADDDTAAVLNKAVKYVVTQNPIENPWEKTMRIANYVAKEIGKLKETDGPMLQVHGSSELIQTLLENDLVDEMWLKIFPLILGKGKRLFDRGAMPMAFKLVKSSVTPKGVIIANYERA